MVEAQRMRDRPSSARVAVHQHYDAAPWNVHIDTDERGCSTGDGRSSAGRLSGTCAGRHPVPVMYWYFLHRARIRERGRGRDRAAVRDARSR